MSEVRPTLSGRTRLLAPLGLFGLDHLDAVVLAALATEAPMLLIGPHGSAKSALLEQLAGALHLEHRHYNASLIAFDDLIGFPVPNGDGLRYLRTPGTLWEADSVFLDEISRCRPEIQNKLFSIVHERRVQGLKLEKLRFRWAAMNPPSTDDVGDDARDDYLGSTPLDPALADRFAFVMLLPGLVDLSPDARRAIIRCGAQCVEALSVAADTPNVPDLVAACKTALKRTRHLHGDWTVAYTEALIVPLQEAGLGISGRRAAQLAANVIAVAAAFAVLAADGEISDAALTALRHSLPQRAQGKAVDPGVLATIHRQAMDAATAVHTGRALNRILAEADPVRRVGLALSALRKKPGGIARDTMSMLVCDALAAQDTQGRWILSEQLLPNLAELDCVDAATLETLALPFMHQVQFECLENLTHQLPRSRLKPFNDLVAALAALDEADPGQVALGNLAAALYRHDDGAPRPEALKRQRAAIALRLEAEAHDAA